MGSLTRHAPARVTFRAGASREGPLTLGQLNIFEWLTNKSDLSYSFIGTTLDIPPGTPVADVSAALSVLLTRHEGLRTSYVRSDPPRQRVAGAGELAIDVYDGDEVPTAAELMRLLRASHEPLDYLGEPLIVGLATRRETVTAGVALFSHLAVDFLAADVVAREFADLVRCPSGETIPCLAGETKGRSRHHPLDEAELERQPRARDRANAALRQWECLLRTMPQCLYTCPSGEDSDVSGAVTLTSPAGAIALAQIAARAKVSRPTVVLAAVCGLLGQRTGHPVVTFPILSGNRLERRLTEYVGTLVQTTLITVDTAAASFDELVRRTWRAVLQAGRIGRYDVYRRAEISSRVAHERGIRFDFEPLFNSVTVDSGPAAPRSRLTPAELSRALDRTELSWRPIPPTSTPLRIDLASFTDALTLRIWMGGIGMISQAEAELLLRALERLLTAAAPGDIGPDGVRAAGVPPFPRGGDWLLADSCWIRPARVQRLAQDALAPATCRVFPGAGGHSLALYLAADGTVRTPADAHSRCMARLTNGADGDGWTDAMAPQWYTVCEGAPDELTDLAGWQRQPVIAAGTGRSAT